MDIKQKEGFWNRIARFFGFISLLFVLYGCAPAHVWRIVEKYGDDPTKTEIFLLNMIDNREYQIYPAEVDKTPGLDVYSIKEPKNQEPKNPKIGDSYSDGCNTHTYMGGGVWSATSAYCGDTPVVNTKLDEIKKLCPSCWVEEKP